MRFTPPAQRHTKPARHQLDHRTKNGHGSGRSAGLTSLRPCPYCELLGIEVTTMENGYARLTMPVAEKLLQPYGVVHGGAIASLADSAAGIALLSANEGSVRPVTIELKLNFILPVSGGTLVAEAQLLHSGRSTAVADVEVRDQDRRLVAKGIVTLLPLRG